jgi:hypothetical protein
LAWLRQGFENYLFKGQLPRSASEEGCKYG